MANRDVTAAAEARVRLRSERALPDSELASAAALLSVLQPSAATVLGFWRVPRGGRVRV